MKSQTLPSPHFHSPTGLPPYQDLKPGFRQTKTSESFSYSHLGMGKETRVMIIAQNRNKTTKSS